MSIHVVQGEREMVSDGRSLARFDLKGLPPLGAGMAKIQVTFSVDADGLLDVSAHETTSGISASVEVKPSYGLDDDTVERMILESFEHAEDDVQKRVLAEAKVEADRILAALAVALETDAALLEPGELDKIEAAQAALQEAVEKEVARLINDRVTKLDETSAEFAARRMNQSINRALSGRSAEEAV
jgi:molecular chaperone HscA